MGMPATIHASFAGTAQAFQASLSNQPLSDPGGAGAVYIVLGMLYESYIHPITILSTLPSAGVGALLALLLCHTDLSVIAIIGIILLIGIVKKNAILMIDFALDAERKEGKHARRGHLSGVPAAFPSDHDDDDGGSVRCVAAGARHGHRLGTAPAAGHQHRGRIDREPDADAVHDARGLPLYGHACADFWRGASRFGKRICSLRRSSTLDKSAVRLRFENL